jgi:rSAM/selenodomain-associated transferase 1
MTKAPRAGKVKTRLVPPLTAEEAAALNICFLRDLTGSIEWAARSGEAMGIAVYTPVGSESLYADILPNDFSLLAQRGEGFGERLFFASKDILQLGFASVCLINSDSPTVPAEFFAEAIQILSQSGDRVVLGPSDDGGYYLIGLKKLHRRIFEDIDWSTEKVLHQTIDRARERQLDVHLLPSWFDVDDSASLRRLCKSLPDSETSKRAPATTHLLNELLARDHARILPNE